MEYEEPKWWKCTFCGTDNCFRGFRRPENGIYFQTTISESGEKTTEKVPVAFCRNCHVMIDRRTIDINPETEAQIILYLVGCQNPKCHQIFPHPDHEDWHWRDKRNYEGHIICGKCRTYNNVRNYVAIALSVGWSDFEGGGVADGHY